MSDVIYGDVWVCSGQSNMQWNIGGIFNASEEISKLAEYPNIRMYFVKLMTSDEPQEDLMNEDWAIWAKSSQTNYVSSFSAVCLLTARYMADAMGKDKVIVSNMELNMYQIMITQLVLNNLFNYLSCNLTINQNFNV